jgi:hypothetical protein
MGFREHFCLCRPARERIEGSLDVSGTEALKASVIRLSSRSRAGV